MQYRYPRPTSITFVGRLLLIWCGFWLVLMPLVIWRVAPHLNEVKTEHAILLACRVVLLTLYIICGTFMLLGRNWSRVFYVTALLPAYIAYSAAIVWYRPPALDEHLPALPAVIVVQAIVLLAVCGLLFSKDANYFFLGRSTLLKKKRSLRQSADPDNPYAKPQARSYDY